MNRRYSELITLDTPEERFEYLRLNGRVGEETFGYQRHLNQELYSGSDWKRFRRDIIVRDNGCDMALPDNEIGGMIVVHHINPITAEDVESNSYKIWDPENVVCVSDRTHKAIHYGDKNLLPEKLNVRKPGDTKLW